MIKYMPDYDCFSVLLPEATYKPLSPDELDQLLRDGRHAKSERVAHLEQQDV